MAERSFSWMPKFTRISKMIKDPIQKLAFMEAILDYGTYGIEPELDYPFNLSFEGVREDIDYSINARTKNKGGRPKKTSEKTQETPVSEVKTGVSEVLTGVSNNETGDTDTETQASITSITSITSNASKQDINTSSLSSSVVSYLNEKAGSSFKASSKNTQSLIKARTREGFTIDDFKTVIDGRVKAWANDPKMSEYLRPQTLFGTKFESYLNASKAKPKTDEEEWDELFEEYARYERENTTVYCPPC